MQQLKGIDPTRIPRHVAIIMDGNGRWAKARGQERTFGHAQGAQQAHEIMEAAVRLGIDYLTLYTFSTENWNRPVDEVAALMTLLLEHLKEELFMEHNARLRVIGDRRRLPQTVQTAIGDMETATAHNTGTCMVLALSYSAKWELTQAMQAIAREAAGGQLQPEAIDEATISAHLETRFMPDPELLIRTGGEQRISNFLLWQCAYSEFYFTPVYWPDFTEAEFHKAIIDYQHRQRRFGKTGEQVEAHPNEPKPTSHTR